MSAPEVPQPPLVSVVIRSMDRPLLDRALRSVAAQDIETAEILVVKASREHRPMAPLCGRFEMRLVDAMRPLHRGEAANVGLMAGRGDYIYFLDDDDEVLPGALTALVEAIRANPGSALSHGRSEVVDANGQVLHYFGSPFRRDLRLSCGFFGPGGFLMARELVTKGARFDTNLSILEDLDFFAQLSDLTQFTYIDRAVQRYWSETGNSGAGIGPNEDRERLNQALAYIHRKHAPQG